MNLAPEGLVFFLGGHDLEMFAIRELLKTHGVRFHDCNLRWGAEASAYRTDIANALARGETPVLVEIDDDLGLVAAGRAPQVDHHGPRAGANQPTALEQIFRLLRLPPTAWTRQLTLVAVTSVPLRQPVLQWMKSGRFARQTAVSRA